MKRFDIAQARTGGVMVESEEDGDYVLYDEVAPALAALVRLHAWAQAQSPETFFGGDHPIAAARAAIAQTTGGAA